ncbi:MAG: Ig-like domain-containing protein, partial [Burkholderiales bacterium]
MLPGESAQLAATLTYSDGSTKDVTSTATWSTSAVAVLTVSSAGAIAAVAPGQAEVTASTQGLSARGTVRVVAPAPQPVSLAIGGTPASPLTPGQVAQLTALVTYSDASVRDVTSTAAWSTSDAAIVSVSAAGLIQAHAPGQAQITAAAETHSGRTAVQVVSGIPPEIAPIITGQPADISVLVGDAASFRVTATGSPLNYQWEGSQAGAYLPIAGATGSAYTIDRVTAEQDGTLYRVLVHNGAGSVYSDSARLAVAEPVSPAFTMQPTEQSVTASTVVTFTSTVSGVPTPVLQWQQSADDGVTWTDIAGAMAESYTVTATSADNGRRFRLLATNRVGSAVSDVVALYVNPSTAGLACSGPNGSGWCRISPVQPNTLNAVTKVEASTLVAVGEAGT